MRRSMVIAGLLLLNAAAACFILSTRETEPYEEAKEVHEQLRREYTEMPDEGSDHGQEEAAEEELLDREIDWEALRSMNQDIIAWIYVPGTQIDYPVCQAKGEALDYYLNRNVYGRSDLLGTLFISPELSDDFSDWHTVIYGHNTYSGQMFGELLKFKSQDFRDIYPFVYIYMPEKNIKYEIYNAYECHSRSEDYRLSFDTREEYWQWMQLTMHPAAYEGVESPKGQIVTLSTCTEGEYRFVVHCRKAGQVIRDRMV